MSTLFIDEQGSILSRIDQRFVVRREGKVIIDLPAFRINQIIIMGNIQITPEAAKLIFKKNIDTVFMSTKGKFYGRLFQMNLSQVENRVLQYEKCINKNFSLNLSRHFVRGKLANYRNLLLQMGRGKIQKVKDATFKLRTIASKLQETKSIESLLGIEGAGSAIYFGSLKDLFKQDLGFEKRQKRPPKDPVNSMLSFGYTLLYREFSVLINMVGLDPFLGFFHSPQNNRESLALDLMEEFRPVIDRIVLTLVNRREVCEDDFIKHKAGSVTIKKPSIALLMKRFYDELAADYPYPKLGENQTLRKVMLNQVRLLVKTLKEEEEYQPYEIS